MSKLMEQLRSPFLPIVANLYMETFERKVITLAIASTRLRLRYAEHKITAGHPPISRHLSKVTV